MRSATMKRLAWPVLVWAVIFGSMPTQVLAGPVPSSLGDVGSTRENDLAQIEEMLSNPELVKKLAQKGVTPDDLRAKLNKMSDHEVHMLAQRLENVKSGGAAAGVIIGVLVIVALVYLIIYLVQRT